MAAIIAAVIPIMLALAGLIPVAIGKDANPATGWLLLRDAFNWSCITLGPLAIGLAILDSRKNQADQRSILIWIAVGLAIGETVPIWWIAVELVFGIGVVIVGLFHSLI